MADAPPAALKRSVEPLDSSPTMRAQEIRSRVQRADYAIDPALVAQAMLRHAISHRRCWKPRAACATPADSSSTPPGPSQTTPIQVSCTADSAARRSASPTQTSSS